MAKSVAEADLALDLLRGGSAITPQATVWVSLHSSDPGITGTGEVAFTGNYARVSLTASSAWSAKTTVGADRLMDNAAAVNFTAPTTWAATGVAWFGLWKHATSQTAANFLRGGTLTSGAVSIAVGDTVSFPAGDLNVTER